MSITALVSLLVNNGAAIGCLAYFMWFNSTIIKELRDLIAGVKADQQETNARLESIEIKLEMEADNNDESC